MPLLATPETLDTISTTVTCIYQPQALGGSPTVSPNIYLNKQQLKYYKSNQAVSDLQGEPTPLNILGDPCVSPRVVIATVNQTVFFNKNLPAVQGDKAQALGTDRPLTAPFGDPTVIIGSRG